MATNVTEPQLSEHVEMDWEADSLGVHWIPLEDKPRTRFEILYPYGEGLIRYSPPEYHLSPSNGRKRVALDLGEQDYKRTKRGGIDSAADVETAEARGRLLCGVVSREVAAALQEQQKVLAQELEAVQQRHAAELEDRLAVQRRELEDQAQANVAAALAQQRRQADKAQAEQQRRADDSLATARRQHEALAAQVAHLQQQLADGNSRDAEVERLVVSAADEVQRERAAWFTERDTLLSQLAKQQELVVVASQRYDQFQVERAEEKESLEMALAKADKKAADMKTLAEMNEKMRWEDIDRVRAEAEDRFQKVQADWTQRARQDRDKIARLEAALSGQDGAVTDIRLDDEPAGDSYAGYKEDTRTELPRDRDDDRLASSFSHEELYDKWQMAKDQMRWALGKAKGADEMSDRLQKQLREAYNLLRKHGVGKGRDEGDELADELSSALTVADA